MDAVSARADHEVSLCTCCGLPRKDEELLMCLGCGSLYCGQELCQTVCPCHDAVSAPIPNRPAETLFARLVDSNPFAVIIKDAGGTVIHATDSDSLLSRTLGFSSSQLVGMTNLDLFRTRESTTLDEVEFKVAARLRPFRFVANLTTTRGHVYRFMVEVAPYRITPTEHLTVTTLTPAAAPMAACTAEESSKLCALAA